MITIHVQQGRQHVNAIRIYSIGEGHWFVSADLAAKRCEVGGVASSGDEKTIILSSTPETLHEDTAKADDTWIFIRGLPLGCACLAEVSRYTLRVYIGVDVEEEKPVVEFFGDKEAANDCP